MGGQESNVCLIHSDCTKVVDGVEILKVCYESAAFSTSVNFCECSPWFGWTGENCDQASTQVRFFIGIILAIFFVCFVLSIVIAKMWVQIVKIYLRDRKINTFKGGKSHKKGYWETATLLLFSSLTVISVGFYCSLYLVTFTDPHNLKIIEVIRVNAEITQLVSPLVFVDPGTILPLMFTFLISNSLLTSISWLETSQLMHIFSADSKGERRVKGLIKSIRVFRALFIVVCFGLMIADFNYAITFMVPLVVIILLFFYSCGASKLLSMIKMAANTGNSKNYEDLRKTIRISAIGQFSCLLSLTVCVLIYGLSVAKMNEFLTKPGDLNVAVLLIHVAVLCGLSLVALDCFYVKKRIINLQTQVTDTRSPIRTKEGSTLIVSGIQNSVALNAEASTETNVNL